MKADVHRALWITFLSRRFLDSPENVRETELREPRTGQPSVLQVLKANEKEIPKVLLGVALWNLLPAFQQGALGMHETQYKGLIADVFTRPVAEILQVSPDVQTPVFPADPAQLIQEPILTQEENLNASILRLEVLLDGSLAEMTPDPVSPKFWTERGNPFWSRVGDLPKKEKWRGTVPARVQLPDPAPSVPVAVDLQVDISQGEFEGRTDFTIQPNDRMTVCSGYLSIRKEEGRPGKIRVSVQRTLRFSRSLDQFRVPTALYWMYSDLICSVYERLVEIRQKEQPAMKVMGKAKKTGQPALKKTPKQTPGQIPAKI